MNSKLNPKDKRHHPRLGHSMLTEVVQEGSQTQEALALDFSLSGVRLALTHPVAADQPLQLRLMLPPTDIENSQREVPLDLKARIAWQREEGGYLSCGAEFIGLTVAQKTRLREGFFFVKKLLTASIAGVLLQTVPTFAHGASSVPSVTPSASPATLFSTDILADQRAVNAVSASLQINLGKVMQDVLNLQKNSAGSNNAGLALMYQASLAFNVARLSADGVSLANATNKLNTDAMPILSANTAALQKATAQYQADTKLGNTAARAVSEAAMLKAAQKAASDLQAVYGSLVPTLSDKVQVDIGNLSKGVIKLGMSLLTRNSAAATADKAALTSNITALMADYVAMTQPKTDTPAKPTLQDSVTSLVTSLDSMMVKQADGKSVSVSSLLSSLLSGMIKPPVVTPSPVPTSVSTVPTTVKLMDGSEVAYMQAQVVNAAEMLGLFGINSEAQQDKRLGYAMLTDKAGTTTAIGYGYPVQYSYAKALYSNEDFAQLSDRMGVSNLSGLAQGGGMFAYGSNLDESTRVAVSWSGTAGVVEGPGASANPVWANAKATNLGVGVTHKFNDLVSAGVNVGFLNESHGILGNSYDPHSAFSFGETNHTVSLGLSAGFNLSRNNSLLVEAGFATTKGGNSSGLIAGTTDILSRSYGMTFMSKHLLKDEDRLTASMVKPLRVVSGEVAVVMQNVDAHGVVSSNTGWVSLVPTGSETDYKLSYDMPLKKSQSLSIQASARKDVQNIAGNNDASAGVSWSMKF